MFVCEISRGDCRDREVGPPDWQGRKIITLLEMFGGASGFGVDNVRSEISRFGPIV